MIKRDIRINLESGLEARPIALLVQEAIMYESKIYFQLGDRRLNAKSIMGMMSLGLDNGEQLEVSADGADEQAAVAGIENFLEGRKGA